MAAMLGAAVTAPANPESPANVALAAMALTAGAGWLGYRWFTRHPTGRPFAWRTAGGDHRRRGDCRRRSIPAVARTAPSWR